jgi:RES domain-containing protein
MEIIVRAGARAKLPDAHHCARAWVPEGLSIEDLDPSDLPGWDSPDLAASRAFGDAWLEEQRSVIAYVPAVTAKPLGRHALINPLHLDFANITIEPTIPVTWDARLFAL